MQLVRKLLTGQHIVLWLAVQHIYVQVWTHTVRIIDALICFDTETVTTYCWHYDIHVNIKQKVRETHLFQKGLEFKYCRLRTSLPMCR